MLPGNTHFLSKDSFSSFKDCNLAGVPIFNFINLPNSCNDLCALSIAFFSIFNSLYYYLLVT